MRSFECKAAKRLQFHFPTEHQKPVETRLTADEKQTLSRLIQKMVDSGVKPCTNIDKISKTKERCSSCARSSSLEKEHFESQACHSHTVVARIHGLWKHQESKALAEATGFSELELQRLFYEFISYSSLSQTPFGINYDTFRRRIPLFSVEDDLFSSRVFHVLDVHEQGIWTWEEYLLCMTLLFRSSKMMRAYFLFKIYDVDENGRLSKDEILRFFSSSLLVKVDLHVLEISESFIQALFAEIGNDSEITLEQTLDFVHSNASIEDPASFFGRTMASPNSKKHFQLQVDAARDKVDFEKLKFASPHAIFRDLRTRIFESTSASARERIRVEVSNLKLKRGVHHRKTN
jgi:hypothetical protein